MAQRADGVVVARAPMVLHRQPGKLVVFRVTFVVPSPVDQVDDVVDLVTGDRLQDLQIVLLLKISRKPAQQGSQGALDPVHVLELAGARSRSARKLDLLLTCGDFRHVARRLPLRAPKIDLEGERVLAAGIVLNHPLQRRVGHEAAIPVLLAIDLD